MIATNEKKLPEITSDPYKKTYILVVSFFILINIFFASQHVSSVPLTDGWAVLNKLMLLDLGEVSFLDYIFSYFGAHPHSIIKFLVWLDYRVTGGTQHITALASYFGSAGLGFFLCYLFYSWSKKNLRKSPNILAIGIIIALLTTDLADWQVMTLPFQGVLSISRLCYLVLLWLFLKNIEVGSETKLFLLTFAASIAATFHGAGIIFAAIWLMIGTINIKRIHHLIIAMSPITVWFVQAHLYKSGGELDNIRTLISIEGLINISNALVLYFATPLLPFYDAAHKFIFIFIGFIMMVFTTGLSLLGGLRLLNFRFKSNNRSKLDELTYAGIVSIFVLLTGLAASLLMAIRGGSLADVQVMTTPRYISYAILPYIFISIFLAKTSQKAGVLKAFSFASILLVVAMSVYPTLYYKSIYSPKLDLDRSIALISSGFSPIEAEAMAIWPNAKDDWYWVDALPQTISYLKDNKLGAWHNLPLLGQSHPENINTIQIGHLKSENLTTGPSCFLTKISGILANKLPRHYLDSGVFPILNSSGLVVGFAYQKDGPNELEIAGFVNHKTSQNLSDLRIGPRDDKYVNEASATSVTPYNLTDAIWNDGIARSWPGFFVGDTPRNRELLAPGKVLRFYDGSFRKVERLVVANGFLNIYTENPLINKENGYPKEIFVSEWCKPTR